MSNSDAFKDKQLLNMFQKALKNKGKRNIEKQKEIYKATQKYLIEQLTEDESNE